MTTNTKTWSKPTIKKVTGQRGLHPKMGICTAANWDPDWWVFDHFRITVVKAQ